MAELLVVVKDRRHGLHAGVLRTGVIALHRRLEPIVNPPDERRDQLRAGLGASHRLDERKKEREVAVDAFLFQHLGGPDPLPGGRDLDQDAIPRNPLRLVERDELAALCDRPRSVKRQACVGFGGDAAGDDFENLHAERNEQVVDHILDLRRAGEPAAFALREHLVQNVGIGRLRRRLENERGIRGRVLRLKLAHRLEVAGVGNDGGELLELVELARLRGGRGGGAHGVDRLGG